MRLLTLFVCAFGAVALAQSSEPQAPAADVNERLRASALQRLARELRAETPAAAPDKAAKELEPSGTPQIARQCMAYMPRAAVQLHIDKKMALRMSKGTREKDTIAPPVPECASR